MSQNNYRALFQIRSFSCYAVSAFLALTAYGMSYITLTWMVLHWKVGVSAVAILMFCFWLPGVFLGPVAGVWVDRYCRKRLYLFTGWSRGLLLLTLGIVEWNYHLLWPIYVSAALEGTITSFLYPAAVRLIREMVPQEALLPANSMVDMIYEVGNVVGMGVAGFVIAFLSNAGTLMVVGILFFVATLFGLGIKVTRGPSQVQHVQTSVLSEMCDGFVYIFNDRTIQVAYALQLLALVVYNMIPVLTAPFATRYLFATVSQFGTIEAVLSFGVVFGNFMAPILVDYFGRLRVLLALNIILALAFVLFSENRRLIDAELLNFFIGVGFATWPVLMTQAQQLTDITMQGRVQSTFSALSAFVMSALYGLVFLSGQTVSLIALYYVEAGLAVLSIVLLISYRRQLFTSP